MKTSHIKRTRLLLSSLVCFASINLAQAGTQPSVIVKSYAQHIGNNIVYNYLVTNNKTRPLTEINIGCICPNDFTGKSPDSVPQLVIYPIDYFAITTGRVSPGSYSAPSGWKGLVVHYDEIGYFSFEFSTPFQSGISLLPGQTGNFSITTPKVEKLGYFVGGVGSRPEGLAYYYEMNQRGYLNGYYSYYDKDTDGKGKEFSYPMQLIDQTPPTLIVTLNPNKLWSPNEKSVPITATITVKDDYDPQPEIQLVSITANETLDRDDAMAVKPGTDNRQFMLKAKREGKNKAGRIYTVTYSATDGSGNKATASATVTVPHDEREHEGGKDEKSRKNGKD